MGQGKLLFHRIMLCTMTTTVTMVTTMTKSQDTQLNSFRNRFISSLCYTRYDQHMTLPQPKGSNRARMRYSATRQCSDGVCVTIVTATSLLVLGLYGFYLLCCAVVVKPDCRVDKMLFISPSDVCWCIAKAFSCEIDINSVNAVKMTKIMGYRIKFDVSLVMHDNTGQAVTGQLVVNGTGLNSFQTIYNYGYCFE